MPGLLPQVPQQGSAVHRLIGCWGMQVDSELVYAYAKTNNLAALEEFISGAHQANLGQVCSPPQISV